MSIGMVILWHRSCGTSCLLNSLCCTLWHLLCFFNRSSASFVRGGFSHTWGLRLPMSIIFLASSGVAYFFHAPLGGHVGSGFVKHWGWPLQCSRSQSSCNPFRFVHWQPTLRSLPISSTLLLRGFTHGGVVCKQSVQTFYLKIYATSSITNVSIIKTFFVIMYALASAVLT